MTDGQDSGRPGSPVKPRRPRLPRVSRACSRCRLRKIRCDGLRPCASCKGFERSCEFSSTRKQKVPGAPRTKILEARLLRVKALITQLQAQNPDLDLDKDLNEIFNSPPASPCSQSESRHTFDDSPSSGVPDEIDEKACPPSNQYVSRSYGDTEMNEVVINAGPLRHTPRPVIGEDQRWMLKEDDIDHVSLFAVGQPQFHHEALPSSVCTQPQVAFPGQPAMYSHPVDFFPIPATTESSIGQMMTQAPYLQESRWRHCDRSQTPHNITGTF